MPSVPTFDHIPPPNSQKSLLFSKDDVFKEIKDVGEDNSTSSLHLFHVNGEVPPSSYHESPQKLLDEYEEQEEMKTAVNDIPSSYHHYLGVFSKVKAKVFLPHHAYSYHIKLEESVPPFVVI
ncbi:hypothetical protein O181_036422 [Austropuccinia psidii MF-1]|uniref:Uncharacterized protein n=1 Tax=Austropuccinia psidii MF-1 TaxID=1389203 RepID=A0A9Q3H9X4_9BASI|nr:hypothetical protein [Austropuccinia psidii MF-1]